MKLGSWLLLQALLQMMLVYKCGQTNGKGHQETRSGIG